MWKQYFNCRSGKSVRAVAAGLRRWAAGAAAVGAFGAQAAGIDNSGLLPPILPDSQVKLEKRSAGATASPDWVRSLILVEANPATASADGTLAGLTGLLDHLAETGVNGLWLTPVNAGRHYTNHGIHTVNAALTGEKEPARQWQALRNFVDEAHKRNIRVFFDVISWGVNKEAPLYREKPEWFDGFHKAYNGWLWKWDNPELNEWFASRLVEWLVMTGADGFRCDCGPRYARYAPYREARRRLSELGRQAVFISEHASERKETFDFDQLAFCETGRTFKDGKMLIEKNIVDVVRSGEGLGNVDVKAPGGRERFYAFTLSCHDNKSYMAQGDPIRFGYQALFSPFIPIWYLGEEWNNADPGKAPELWMYAGKIDWKLVEANRPFFERIKQMIRIRRSYPEIFEYFPVDHRDSNICKVVTDRPELLQPYARFGNGTAVLVVPNNGEKDERFRITLPVDGAKLFRDRPYRIVDLLNDRQLAVGKLSAFEAQIPAGSLGVFLAEPEKP